MAGEVLGEALGFNIEGMRLGERVPGSSLRGDCGDTVFG